MANIPEGPTIGIPTMRNVKMERRVQRAKMNKKKKKKGRYEKNTNVTRSNEKYADMQIH